jgi:hypothetical protein
MVRRAHPTLLPHPAKMFYNTSVQDFIKTLTAYILPNRRERKKMGRRV